MLSNFEILNFFLVDQYKLSEVFKHSSLFTDSLKLASDVLHFSYNHLALTQITRDRF